MNLGKSCASGLADFWKRRSATAAITLTGLCLGFAGLFALFQSSTGYFLPHDSAFLQMEARDLCAPSKSVIVHFMFHDRVSFGGALIAIAVVYLAGGIPTAGG